MPATSAGVTIRPVETPRDRDAFVRLPWRIYRHDPNWIPPLIRDEKRFISREHNPFHRHADVVHLLADRAGTVVGRIAAVHNQLHNSFHADRVGFFGLFECDDDEAVAQALFDAAAGWLRGRGLRTLRGPMSYSTNETCGILIDGDPGPPYLMMPHNPRYYVRLIEGAGFDKAKDLVAYHVSREAVSERAVEIGRLAASRSDARVRALNMKRWQDEVEIIRDIYNRSWERNWGFVPFTPEEFGHMAETLKQVVDPRLVGILESDGRAVGFGLALPDANLAIRKANGRLFPFGIVKVLLASRRIHRVRVPILGIVPEYRGRGLDWLLYLHIYRNGIARGYVEGEFSWILEDNLPMRKALERFGARVHRTYRIYDRPIA
jgi:GNAT superfamily N-acetyltransferase